MSTYAIGDVQGCFDELQALLSNIHFNSEKDTLWFTGDLVNRGPKSLDVLRFVKNLRNAIVVLGNHDLHLLAVAKNPHHVKESHTFDDVLASPDCDELIQWLKQQPLLHHDKKLGYTMVHAGLPPQWDLKIAKRCAEEVKQLMQSNDYDQYLQCMYDDTPKAWDKNLKGKNRACFIINAFTRIRFCDQQGVLLFGEKGKIGTQPKNYLPWFKVPHRANKQLHIIFGHWSAINGKTDEDHVFALDTGCVWGGCLTALRLDDGKRFSVNCSQRCSFS